MSSAASSSSGSSQFWAYITRSSDTGHLSRCVLPVRLDRASDDGAKPFARVVERRSAVRDCAIETGGVELFRTVEQPRDRFCLADDVFQARISGQLDDLDEVAENLSVHGERQRLSAADPIRVGGGDASAYKRKQLA